MCSIEEVLWKLFLKIFFSKFPDKLIEAANIGALKKKVFLKILQNTCASSLYLIKLQVSGLQFYLKRDSGTDVFLWILRYF